MLSMPAGALKTRRYRDLCLSDIANIGRIFVSIDGVGEARGSLDLWRYLKDENDSRLVYISREGLASVKFESLGENKIVALSDDAGILEALQAFNITVLLDITAMEHVVWASLLRAAYNGSVDLRILYAEPSEYKVHPNPSSSSAFDLSVKLQGVSPLPGYAQLEGPIDESLCVFVPALGFEGNRPSCLLVGIDPVPKVVPVVGVPGFQLEYAATTVACNRDFLEEQDAYNEIRVARASCPFDFIRVLEQIAADNPGCYIYMGLVGTKPHAVGATYYWLKNKSVSEILFDHPVKREGRTSGVGTIHVYDFSEFCSVEHG